MHSIFQMAILVNDYDEAIDFYTNVLGFRLVEDTVLSETKRWVVVRPSGSNAGASLLLARAVTPEQRAAVGNQSGGRVFLFIHTTNLNADLERFKAHQVKIVRGPVQEEFGKVAVIEDLYGNKLDIIER